LNTSVEKTRQVEVPKPSRILIVDDHANARFALAALLEDEGLAVDEASNLSEARRCLSASTPYLAILLDAHLGNAESGLDLLVESRAHSNDAIVIILTGDDALIHSGTTGADAVFEKSQGIGPLLARISRAPKMSVCTT
jgi:DNA-binding response OmpR family regulator